MYISTGCTSDDATLYVNLELLGARVLVQRRVASPRMLGYQRREREREQRTRHRRKLLKESDRGPRIHHSQTAFVGGAGRSE